MARPDEDDTIRQEVDDLSSSVSRGPRTRAVLTVLRGENVGALYTMETSMLVIGRAPDVDVAIPDDALSRRHACIRRKGVAFTIEDLGSTNGTFVDAQRVDGPTNLSDGCRIYLGSRAVLHFRLHDTVELAVLRETHARAVKDPLTGIFNRRHLEDKLWSEVAFSRRHGTPLSLLLLDIDHFKRINDEHGHPTGDAVLKLLADELSLLTREEDTLARCGGEEFALVARGIDRRAALHLGERIRQVVEAKRLALPGASIGFTVSIGIAHWETGEALTPQWMFEAADRALYASKGAGRNSVSMAPPPDC